MCNVTRFEFFFHFGAPALAFVSLSAPLLLRTSQTVGTDSVVLIHVLSSTSRDSMIFLGLATTWLFMKLCFSADFSMAYC